jgi:peptide/nickel transport system substrate-binding protein
MQTRYPLVIVVVCGLLAGPAWTPVVEAAAAMKSELSVAQTFDPSRDLSPYSNLAVAGVDIRRHFIETLWEMDRQGNVQGLIVERWDFLSPTEWVLHLRKGLKFHDPKYGELTADDVKFQIDATTQRGESLKFILPKVIQDGRVEVVDRYTVRWKLAPPGTGSLPNWGTLIPVSAKAYIEGEGKEAFALHPIGTGPYRFVEMVPNQRIVGEVFKDYWRQLPGFERIVWRIIPDPFTVKSEFLAGGIDVWQFVPPEIIPEIEKHPNLHIATTPSSRMLFMVIDASHPPLDNKLIRQALNYAVDKTGIVETLYRGKAMALRAPMQEVLPELNKTLPGYPYDPEKARQLLEQAGYHGQKIEVGAPIGRYTLDKELGEAVAGMLEQVGVNVAYKPQEWGTYAPPLFRGEKVGVNLIGMGNAPMLPEFVFTLWLLPGGQGEVYAKGRPEHWEREVGEVAMLPRSDPRRQEILNDVQAEALDFAPWILLVNLVDVYGMSDKVEWAPFPTESRYFYDAKRR